MNRFILGMCAVLFALVLAFFSVAYGTNNPKEFGHTAEEIHVVFDGITQTLNTLLSEHDSKIEEISQSVDQVVAQQKQGVFVVANSTGASIPLRQVESLCSDGCTIRIVNIFSDGRLYTQVVAAGMYYKDELHYGQVNVGQRKCNGSVLNACKCEQKGQSIEITPSHDIRTCMWSIVD